MVKNKIIPILRYEALLLIVLPIVVLSYKTEISTLLKVGVVFLIISCIYAIGESYSFSDTYLEKSFFGKKRKILLKDIISVRHSLYFGTYIIRTNDIKHICFRLDLSFQKDKRELLFNYIKSQNPTCDFET